MKIIGITGPTGAGKTTALAVLESLGGVIIDADAVYHKLLKESKQLKEELVTLFGDILDVDQEVDRKKLGNIVFADPSALEKLSELTHKYVEVAVMAQIEHAKREEKCAVAIDAIALIESGLGDLCHEVLAVVADEDLRVKRIMAREGISEEYARKRVSAQKKEVFFRENSTYVLENQELDSPESFGKRAMEWFVTII